MSIIRAYFDGKVFVPDGPVEMPLGTKVEVLAMPPRGEAPLMELVRILESMPDDSDLPPDAASEVDHYLYGMPKRGMS